MLYTLTLGWPLTWFPLQPLRKNREDMHCISRFEGIWLHWTPRVLISSTNFNGNHLLAASLRDPHWDEHYLLSLLNNLDDGTECTPNKLESEIKLEGAVNTLESYIQLFLDGLEKWADIRKLRKFNRSNCRVSHRGWNNLVQWHRLARKEICRQGTGESFQC